MTREEAVNVARQLAEQNRWTWTEPVRAVRSRRWWFGPAYWRVTSNATARGRNVIVTIDDASRKVMQAKFAPR
jgi:hypothetical protein